MMMVVVCSKTDVNRIGLKLSVRPSVARVSEREKEREMGRKTNPTAKNRRQRRQRRRRRMSVRLFSRRVVALSYFQKEEGSKKPEEGGDREPRNKTERSAVAVSLSVPSPPLPHFHLSILCSGASMQKGHCHPNYAILSRMCDRTHWSRVVCSLEWKGRGEKGNCRQRL